MLLTSAILHAILLIDWERKQVINENETKGDKHGKQNQRFENSKRGID